MGYLGENFICLTVNRSGTFQVAEEARREGRVGGGQHWRPYRRCSVLGIHASLVVDGDVVTSSVNAYFTYRLLLTFLVVFFFPHLFPPLSYFGGRHSYPMNSKWLIHPTRSKVGGCATRQHSTRYAIYPTKSLEHDCAASCLILLFPPHFFEKKYFIYIYILLL